MKIIDEIYDCRLLSHHSETWYLKCHLEIFQIYSKSEIMSDVKTVMISDMAFELGWFIPQLVERFIEHVVEEFYLDPKRLIWIECYKTRYARSTSTDFSEVVFEWNQGRAQDLKWKDVYWPSIQELMSDNFLRLPIHDLMPKESLVNSADLLGLYPSIN
jgi:hypothetical protein